jgi:hypothetical protein
LREERNWKGGEERGWLSRRRRRGRKDKAQTYCFYVVPMYIYFSEIYHFTNIFCCEWALNGLERVQE